MKTDKKIEEIKLEYENYMYSRFDGMFATKIINTAWNVIAPHLISSDEIKREAFEKGNVAEKTYSSGQNTPQLGNHIKAQQLDKLKIKLYKACRSDIDTDHPIGINCFDGILETYLQSLDKGEK